jgi:3',5'-cyclic AMP phosphodiesterase CpdA
MIVRRHFLKLGLGALALPVLELPAAKVYAPALRFLFFSDVHAMLEHEAPRKLREIARRMRDTDCDLIVGGGDFVHGGYASTAAAMEPRVAVLGEFLDALDRPVEAVLGNHDMVGVSPADGSPPEADPTRLFRSTFGLKETRRSFDHGGYRFVILDSVQPLGGTQYRGWVGEAQIAWLRELLTKTPLEMPIVLCSHVPFRSMFFQTKDGPEAALPANLVVGDANDVLALFAQHRLVLVLQGHLHVNESLRWNERTFLTGGAVSGSWWKGDNLGTPPGFGTLNVAPGRCDWDYIAPQFAS